MESLKILIKSDKLKPIVYEGIYRVCRITLVVMSVFLIFQLIECIKMAAL